MTASTTAPATGTTGTVEYTLSVAESAAMRRLIADLPQLTYAGVDAAAIDTIRSAALCLPPSIRERMQACRDTLQRCGAVLVHDVPVDASPPPTPDAGSTHGDRTVACSAYALLMHAALLGEVIAYREEKGGLLVHDVCPQPGYEERQENVGSAYFDMHTEFASHDFRPDLIGFVCVRPDHQVRARTLAAPAAPALAELDAGDVDMLRRPLYRTRFPSSLQLADAAPPVSAARPVVVDHGGLAGVCVHAHNTVPVVPHASAPLRALLDSLRRRLSGWALRSGDLMLIDNRVAVHARTAFTPHYDGRDRWLQRVYVICEPAKVAWIRQRRSHVISERDARSAADAAPPVV